MIDDGTGTASASDHAQVGAGGTAISPAPWAERLAALRAAGAETTDPVGLRFATALARRAEAQHGPLRAATEQRLHQALARLEQGLASSPPAASPTAAQPSPLRALLDAFAHTHDEATTNHSEAAAPRELRSAQAFRAEWSALSASRQIDDALAQAPANAGPLNSHHLILQAIARLQTLAPDYLRRFLSYAEALQRLDPGAIPRPAAPTVANKAPAAKTTRRRRAG